LKVFKKDDDALKWVKQNDKMIKPLDEALQNETANILIKFLLGVKWKNAQLLSYHFTL